MIWHSSCGRKVSNPRSELLGWGSPVVPVEEPKILEKRKRGRPAHKPTDETRKMVTSAVGMGLEQKMIARLLDISPPTLRTFYRAELDTGVARANLTVARSLYGRASGGKATIASIFWLKARAGWQDTTKTVQEGMPENITVSFALRHPKEGPVIDVTPVTTTPDRQITHENDPD